MPGVRAICGGLGLLQTERWSEQTKELPQYVRTSLVASENEPKAKQRALEEGTIDARERLCAYAQSNNFRLLSALSSPKVWHCTPVDQRSDLRLRWECSVQSARARSDGWVPVSCAQKG